MEQSYYYGVGRRKTAVAVVRLIPGTGQILVNGHPASQAFPRLALQAMLQQPLLATESVGRYNVVAKVQGGGISAQAGAVRHGIARALLRANAELRGALRGAGLLTRDSRVKERKKYGLKRARKAPQYTKR